MVLYGKNLRMATLSMLDPEGRGREIRWLEPNESVKAVGMMQAANGNMEGQLSVIQEQLEDMGVKLRDGWVPQNLAWQGFHSMLWPSLKYTLPVMMFSQNQADELTTQLYKLILPMRGASKSFPKVYQHAPRSLQGLDTPNFYVEQNITKINKLLTNGDTAMMMGNLLTAQLEQAQLEVGIGIPILDAPFD